MSDDNEYSEDYAPKPPGMSSGTKVLLISLAVLGVLVVACCGGAIWFVQKNIDVDASNDPTVVRATQESILDVDVPGRFEPTQSMRMKIVVANMDMAMFEATGEERSELALMKMIFTMDNMNDAQAEAQFNQQNPSSAQLKDAKTESKTYTIDGKEISVTFAHGLLQEGENAPADQIGKEWYTVSSMMSVPNGMVMFTMAGPEEEFDEEEVETMINSIRFPAEE